MKDSRLSRACDFCLAVIEGAIAGALGAYIVGSSWLS